MLPKRDRLNREVYSHIFRSGQASHSTHFILKSAPMAGSKVRVGASVSKKVSKKAVVRNRTRRRIYSAVAHMIDSLPQKLYLIIAKPGSELLRGEKLEQELAGLLKTR